VTYGPPCANAMVLRGLLAAGVGKASVRQEDRAQNGPKGPFSPESIDYKPWPPAYAHGNE